MGLGELRQVLVAPTEVSTPAAAQAATRELRRPPLPELRLFRVRVDLKHAKPPIWRRLELRSDLTLDVVHKVLQAAFDWMDYHLWRFSLGGGPWDRGSQMFLCEWDIQEGELEDEGGVPAKDVRLDETIQRPGDLLSYVYDYGDDWELILKLEDVLPADPKDPSALLIGGRQAAPPEDCGSLRTREELAEVLEDPDRFDIDAVNAALRGPLMVLAENGFDRRLVAMLNRLAYSPVGEDLTAHAAKLLGDRELPDEHAMRAALRPFIWFLDRAAESPLELTAAGYLKPADVEAAAAVLPTMSGWIGKANREIDATPVLGFRELLQSLGLLRKYKGTLRLTRSGTNAQEAWEELWNVLADKLAPADEGFDAEATLLTLLYAATSAEQELQLAGAANALNHLGWQTSDGRPVSEHALYWLPVTQVIMSVSDWPDRRRDRWRISPVAAELARAVLLPG